HPHATSCNRPASSDGCVAAPVVLRLFGESEEAAGSVSRGRCSLFQGLLRDVVPP
ncbi:unnamed protein product, partial [Ectocarpus sp. 13 AM-2016]